MSISGTEASSPGAPDSGSASVPVFPDHVYAIGEAAALAPEACHDLACPGASIGALLAPGTVLVASTESCPGPFSLLELLSHPAQACASVFPCCFPWFLTSIVAHRSRLTQCLLQCLRGLLLHVGQEVGVDVKGDAYGGVAEHLGDDLGVHVLGEQQRGAGVAEVVEADLGQVGLRQ